MEILYFEPTDEVTRAIERIREVKGTEVALVLPQTSLILQSIVNLKLIARIAQTARKKIVIVTVDKIGRNLALQVGIPVFGKIDKGKVTGKVIQKTPQPVTPSALRDKMLQETEEITTVTGIQVHRYDSSDKLNQLDQVDEADGSAPNEALQEPAAFTKTTVTHLRDASGQEYAGGKRKIRVRVPKSVKRTIIILVVLAVLGTTAWLYWFFPKTVIGIVLKGEAYEYSDNITALEHNDNDSIPLIIKSISKSGEKTISATGVKNVGKQATGKVTLVNEYSTSTQTIPAGQKLRTTDGKEFTLTATVTLPGADISVEGSSTKLNKAGQVEGPVTAAEAGDSYNLTSGKLTLPGISETKDNKIYANGINTSGGTSETKTVVNEQDLANAKNQLIDDLSNQAKQEALASDSDGFVVEDATSVNTTAYNAQANVGDEVGDFRVTGSVEAKVLAINKTALLQKVVAQVNATQDNGKVFVPAANQLELKVRSLSVAEGRLELAVTVPGTLASNVDRNQLQRDLAGKSQDQAETQIKQLPQFESVSLKFDPSWFYHRLAKATQSTMIDIVFSSN